MDVLEPIPAPEARDAMPTVEARMRELALRPDRVQPRRYDPERDGYWDGYDFEIAPEFPDLAELVAAHRDRGQRPDSNQPVGPG